MSFSNERIKDKSRKFGLLLVFVEDVSVYVFVWGEMRGVRVLLLREQGACIEDIKRYIGGKMPELELVAVDSLPLLEKTFSEGSIEAIVTDIDVGWIDYEEVVERVRKRFVYLPVIVYSDLRDVGVITGVIKKGCYDYVLRGEHGLVELADCLRRAVESKESWESVTVRGFIFEKVLSLFPMGIFYVDRDGKLRFIDGSFFQKVSVQPEKYAGRPVEELGKLPLFEKVLGTEGEITDAVDYNKTRIGFMLKESEDGSGKFYVLVDHSHVPLLKEDYMDALREKEILLRELNHRVKNNLQFIMSLLNIYKRNVKVPEISEVLQDIQNRVYPMLAVHEKLYKGDANRSLRMDLLIQSIVGMISRTYSPIVTGVDCRVDIDPIILDADKAISVGMIVNELVTNAYKHAFPDDFRGEKKIRVSMRYDRKKKNYELEISNSGVELENVESLFTGQRLGMKLVRMFAEDRLEGRLRVTSRGGVKFVVMFK